MVRGGKSSGVGFTPLSKQTTPGHEVVAGRAVVKFCPSPAQAGKHGFAMEYLHSSSLAPDDATIMVVYKFTKTYTHTHFRSPSFAIPAEAFGQHRLKGRAAHRLRAVTLDARGKYKTRLRGFP